MGVGTVLAIVAGGLSCTSRGKKPAQIDKSDGTATKVLAPPHEASTVEPDPERSPVAVDQRQDTTRVTYEADLILVWVDGRVVLPAATPDDERLRVRFVESGFPEEDPRSLGVVPEADGSFSLPFVAGRRRGEVQLEAQYLRLPKKVSVNLLAPPRELLLEPVLNARLLIQVGFSDGLLGERLDEVKVSVFSLGGSGDREESPPPTEEGVFAFDDLPTGEPLMVLVYAPDWANGGMDLPALEPTETRRVEVQLTPGATITGRVLDEAGNPVVGLAIEADAPDRRVIADESQAITGEDGRFELSGVPPGHVTLSAFKEGLQELDHEIGPLADGDQVSGLNLTMGTGLILEGRVSWPDGAPVAEATVSLSARRETGASYLPDETWTQTTDDQGSFRFSGLLPGVYDLEASSLLELGEPGSFSARGFIDRLTVPSPPVELWLRRHHTITGRAVDTNGKPVQRFALNIYRAEDPSTAIGTHWLLGRQFRSREGEFRIPAVPSGRWLFRCIPKGNRDISEAAPIEIDVSRDSEFRFVCPVRAVVTGVVLDPGGKAVFGARVHATGLSGSSSTRSTDRGGHFELRVDPGPCRVAAEAEGWAPGPGLELRLVPGEKRSNLVLNLTEAATMLVRLDPSLGDVARRFVSISQVDGDCRDGASTDGAGHCRFDDLAAGIYRVFISPVEEYDEVEDFFALPTERGPVPREVELVAGASLEVVIGGAATHPVRLHGVVSIGREALQGMRISLLGEDYGRLHGSTASDEEGRYELPVEGGTTYRIVLGNTLEGAFHREIGVPTGESSFRFDLELSGASLSGRVLNPSGDVLQGAMVVLETGAGIDGGEVRKTRSSAGGTFQLDNVEVGPCSLIALPSFDSPDDASAFGCSPRLHLQIEAGENQSGLELRLTRPASLVGRVLLTNGSPAADILVEVLDEDLRPAYPWLTRTTSQAGSFVISGLAPGIHRLRATREGWGASSDTPLVSLGEGETVDVEIRMTE